MPRQAIHAEAAPAAIGAYSQAVRVGQTVYLSGQIGLNPATMELVAQDAQAQIRQVFQNLAQVAQAAGGTLADVAKLTVYLTNLEHFAAVNDIMAEFFAEPWPARAAVGVAALPRGALIEADAILVVPG